MYNALSRTHTYVYPYTYSDRNERITIATVFSHTCVTLTTVSTVSTQRKSSAKFSQN